MFDFPALLLLLAFASSSCLIYQFILVWPNSWTPATIVVYLCVCVSADMSPYCSVQDEWLIMKLCMYVGYHDANNVLNFGGDPVTQLNLKKRFIVVFTLFTEMALHSRDAVTVFAAVATRSRTGCSSVEGHTSLSTALVSKHTRNYACCVMD